MAYLGNTTLEDTVDTANIKDGAVTADKLASGVGGSPSIVDNGNATAITIDSSENVDVTGTVTATEFNIAEWLTSTNVLETNAAGQTGARLRAAVSDADTPTFSFNDDTDTGIYTSGSNTLNFSTGGSERLRITSDGRGLSEFTAKAWCNIEGAAQNLMANHNVSSVADNGTGKGTINFAVSMTDSNYAVATHTEDGSGFNDSPTINRDGTQTRSTSQFQYYTYMNGSLNDAVDASFIFFGE